MLRGSTKRFSWIGLLNIVVFLFLALTIGTYWRALGWSSKEETWLYQPSTKTNEFHTLSRLVGIHSGQLEFIRATTISHVQPVAQPVPASVNKTTAWIWRAAGPQRNRSWDKRWFFTGWDDWRVGQTGVYSTTGGGSTSHVFSVSLWAFLMIMCIPYAIVGGQTLVRRYRTRHDLCPNCEYDRRGLSPALKCPECGFTQSKE